jgi:peptide/nickel transport system substrate-binding protein
MFRKWSLLLTALLALAFAMASCTAEPQIVEVTRVVTETVTEVVEVEGEPGTTTEVVVEVTREVEVIVTEIVTETVMAPEEVVDRNGAWLDTVIFVQEPLPDVAVGRLEAGDLDVYATEVVFESLARVNASENLATERAFGLYYELSFNPVGPVFESTGKLNPFAVPAVREAMNWLVDRDYISQEIMGGAAPRWFAFNGASNDYAALADVARTLEQQYAYDKDRASAAIAAEMEALGATLVDGKWQYDGAPVEIILLIRNDGDGLRIPIGDYVANQLEDIGFATVRDYKSGGDASPIWINGDPANGLFHIYTGGWITTAVPRDLGGNFSFFYTNVGLSSPLWQAYENDPEFYELADRLNNNDFSTLEERREMLSRALELSMKDSMRIWLLDKASYFPRAADISVAADLYGGISGSALWPYTLRRTGEVGGSARVAMTSLLTAPWNPLGGSNWIFDAMLYRGTGEFATNPDPFTGLAWPNRIERAEVFIQEGLPVGQTHDWVTLEFVPEIVVPDDAWVDWNAAEQRFITAGEAYTETVTSASKNIIYYPADLYETVKWHDGSNFSAGDIVMSMILTFDRAKEDSPYYDSSAAPALSSFLGAFRGVKILSVDPLILETYTDAYQLDAEQNINTWWPFYAFGQAPWHGLAIGLQADGNGEAAFTSSKAGSLEVEQLSYISGPTIEILKANLDTASAEGFVPFAATMSEFVSADEVAARYTNLTEWHRQRGHFWLGTGVFYLERAFPIEKTVILQRNPMYPDSATKWARFSAPAIAEVELDGPSRVTIGEEAVYDVFVTFEGAEYAVDDIAEVKYLLFGADGSLAEVGQAEAVEDGYWTVTLSADSTSALEAGSNKLEIVVVSKRVALPSAESLQFVTAP